MLQSGVLIQYLCNNEELGVGEGSDGSEDYGQDGQVGRRKCSGNVVWLVAPFIPQARHVSALVT